MNKNKCIIVVPIYKHEFNWDEYNSVNQLFKVLGQYDIIAFCPKSLDITYYQNNFNFKSYYEFWDSYFNEYPNGYNSLLLQPGFYEQFSEYEYMLVYQPDCWVFRDELEYWCNKEYDYIGSPYLNTSTDLDYFDNCSIGNGGLSLRNINFFINICNKYKYIADNLVNEKNNYIGEDHFIIMIRQYNINLNIKLPIYTEALKFSWELNPSFSYQINDHKLPFGCHAYNKIINHKFWDNFICYNKKRYSVVTFLFGDYDILRDPDEIDENAEYICLTDRDDLKSDIWEFKKLNVDLSYYNNWQKTLIARYTALDYINTDQCILVDCSVHIKKSLKNVIDFLSNEDWHMQHNDLGLMINPWRESYLEEYDEWINKRNLDVSQKNDFIEFCNMHNFNIESKGFIMTTIMYIKKSEYTYKFFKHVLTELQNHFNFSERVDQTYFSVILFRYYDHLIKSYLSMQVLDSPYFEYFYHGENYTHAGEYEYDISDIDFKMVNNKLEICKYLI